MIISLFILTIIIFILSLYLYSTKDLYRQNFEIKTLGEKINIKANENVYDRYISILISQQRKAFIGTIILASFLGLTTIWLIVKWEFFSGSWESIMLISGATLQIIGGSAFWFIYSKISKQITNLLLKKN